jgi:SAM-dependent methyltransferase
MPTTRWLREVDGAPRLTASYAIGVTSITEAGMSGMQTEQGLFDAAIESARIFNAVVAECAATAGVFAALRDFQTAADVIDRMGIHPTKTKSFVALLNVLVDVGLLERRAVNGQFAYRTRHDSWQQARGIDGGVRIYQPRMDVLAPWFDRQHFSIVRSVNIERLGRDLSGFRREDPEIRFNSEHLGTWRRNLLNPLYEFGRVIAIRELVQRGHRFLDLASGPGFGAERLSQFSAEECEIVCVDRSRDFLAEARKLIYPRARVRFIERDLNTGLPPLPERYFDGILFNGAFHFIRDKAARLREMRRVLRPGGLLVVGHCFSRSGFEDESMHDLYFAFIENECWPVPWEQLQSMVADAGFFELRAYHRGSHSYLLAERPVTPDDPSHDAAH